MQINHPPEIAIIIPFCERRGDKQCFQRLYNAVSCFSNKSCFEIIVYDSSPKASANFVESISAIPGVRYYHQPEKKLFSPGRARNLAVKKTTANYLFFFDADLLCSEVFADSLLVHTKKLCSEGDQAFAMFPCLYLSRNATNRIFSGEAPDFHKYRDSYLSGALSDVDGIAVASSCLLLSRAWFKEVGEFKTDFAGHGCEDFDLIHRLAAYYPAGALPADYVEDTKEQFPANYRGFRRYFSYYALSHLFTGHFLVHQWHERPLAKLYHRRRKDNERLFANILSNHELPVCKSITPFNSSKPLPEYQQWVAELMQKHELDVQRYPGLFRWRQGVSRPSGSLNRKLRKLVLKPRQFFKDIFFRPI